MEKQPNIYCYRFDLQGVMTYLTDLSKPDHQERLRRLQANNSPATLFTFASFHALLEKYGGETLLHDAIRKETDRK